MEQQSKKRGAPVGNRNARGKWRRRIDVHASLGEERLAHFEKYLQVTSGDDSPLSDLEIAQAARQMLYEWIDKLEV